MQKWEYKTTTVLPDRDEGAANGRMNGWGDDGWELVGVVSAGVNYVRLFFKRPKETP